MSSSDVTPWGEAGPLRPPDTDGSTAAHEANGSPNVSPELAMVDPELGSAAPDESREEVTMSADAATNGVFFSDDKPAASPVLARVAEPPAPAATTAPAPAPSVTPPAAPAPNGTSVMRDVPLGTLIFRAGLVAEEQLEDALHEGTRTGKRLGEVLLERGLLQEQDLGRLLAGQKGLPFIELALTPIDPAAVRLLPEEKARMQHALVLGVENGVPVVAVADPTNELVVENVRRALGLEPRLVVAAHGDLARKIDEAYTEARQNAVAANPVLEEPMTDVMPEPQPETPLAAPTPMPTVLPPAEERTGESQEEVAPPPAAEVAPLAQPPVDVAPLAPPVAAAVPEPTPVPAPPAPVAEQAAVQIVHVVEPESTGLFVQAAEQALAPVAPAEPAPPAAPVVTPEPVAVVQPEPVAVVQPEPVTIVQPEPVQLPVEPAPVAVPAVTPEVAAPTAAVHEPAPVVEATTADPSPGETASPTTHFVALRLAEGEQVEIGSFTSAGEAEAHARSVVAEIAQAEGALTWPFFGGRFVRPQTIVSVDVVEAHAAQWTGSASRTRWAADS